jgi:hypothetical protein
MEKSKSWVICAGAEAAMKDFESGLIYPEPSLRFFFRPFGACSSSHLLTHGWRRGLYSVAASRLGWSNVPPFALLEHPSS